MAFVEKEILKDRPVRGGQVMPVEASDFVSKSALFLPREAQYEYLVNLPDNIASADTKLQVVALEVAALVIEAYLPEVLIVGVALCLVEVALRVECHRLEIVVDGHTVALAACCGGSGRSKPSAAE